MISWFWLTPSVLARELKPFSTFYWFVLYYILFFQVWTLSHAAIFRCVLGCSGQVCFFTVWQTYCDPAVGFCFVPEATNYSPLGYILFREDNLFANRHTSCAVSFRVICWISSILLLNYVFFSPFWYCTVSASEAVLIAAKFSPLWFPFPDGVITTDAMPYHWVFYFQGSGFTVSCCGASPGSMCKVHIALQEL